jgi:hypothetical protein
MTKPGKPVPSHPKALLARLLSSRECVERVHCLLGSLYPEYPEGASVLLVRAVLTTCGLPASFNPNPQRFLTEMIHMGWAIVSPHDIELRTGDVVFLGRGGHIQTVTLAVKQPESLKEEFIALDWEPISGKGFTRKVLLRDVMMVLRAGGT